MHLTKLSCVFFYFCSFTFADKLVGKGTHERKLMSFLGTVMPKYSPPSMVKQRLSITTRVEQLVDVYGREGAWSARIFFKLSYQANFSWEPEEFGNIKEVYIPSRLFWAPFICKYDWFQCNNMQLVNIQIRSFW